jgi:hypothetical protein
MFLFCSKSSDGIRQDVPTLGSLLQCVIEWQHNEQKFEKGEGIQPLRT